MPEENPKSGRKSAGLNAVLSVVGLSSQQIASFVITMLAAGFLSPAEYGVYTLALVFVEFVITLTYTGYFHYCVNGDEDEDRVLSTMFYMMVLIGFIGGAVLFVAAGPLARLFDAPDLAPVLRWLGALQPFAAVIGWASAAFTRARAMRKYFILLGISNFAAMCIGATILIVWESLFALVAYRVARICISLLVMIPVVPTLPKLIFDRDLAIRATRFASGLYGSRMLNFVSRFGTDLVLALLFSTAESGLYRFANRIAVVVNDIVAQPLRSFALNQFGTLGRTKGDMSHTVADFVSVSIFLRGGTAITVIVLASTAIELFFRPEYAAATVAVMALAFRAAAMSVANLVDPIFAAQHRTYISMYHELLWTLVMVATIFLVAPFGFETLSFVQAGVALATSISAIFVISHWGHIDVAPTLRRSLKALAHLAIFAVTFLAGWWGLQQMFAPVDVLVLCMGLAVALILAAGVTLMAWKTGAFTMSVFRE